MIFTKLLLAHLIGDFLLQPQRMVVHKNARKIGSVYFYLHLFVHFILSWMVLWDWDKWSLALIIAISHGIIDVAKLYLGSLFKRELYPFLLDQGLHLGVLYLCSFHTQLPDHFIKAVAALDWPMVTALFFLTYPAAIIMTKLLEGMSGRIGTTHKSFPMPVNILAFWNVCSFFHLSSLANGGPLVC